MLDNCNRRLSESVSFLLHRQTEQNKTSDQFIRIPVEIAAKCYAIPEAGTESLPATAEAECPLSMKRKSHSVGRRILSILRFVGSGAIGRSLSFPCPNPGRWRSMLMRSTKMQEK